MRGVNTYESLQRVLQHALAQQHADAWLVTGDIAQDESESAYRLFRSALPIDDIPVICLPGNHDDPVQMRAVLNDPPWQVLQGLALKEWYICTVDSRVDGQAGGAISQANLEELDRLLTENAHLHCLVALHHQAKAMGSQWLDSVGLANPEKLQAVIEKHQSVRAVVWGHVHQASDRSNADVRYISTPSTCSQFLPHADRFALDTRPPGYRLFDLAADGEVDTRVVWVDE